MIEAPAFLPGRPRVAANGRSVRANEAAQSDPDVTLRAMSAIAADPSAGRRSPSRMSPLSDRLHLHLLSDVLRLADRQSHDRERWIFRCAGRELTAVGDEEILDVVPLAPFVAYAVGGLRAHPAGPKVM